MQTQKQGTYALGPSCIQLGLAAMRQVDIYARVESGLQNLADDTGCHTYMSIWTAAGPIITRFAFSDDNLAVNTSPGQVLPVTRSSSGRVFAAFLSNSQTEPFLNRELTPFGLGGEYEKTIRAKIENVLQQRYATSSGEYESHLKSISVPIMDWHENSLVVAGCTMSVDADDVRVKKVIKLLLRFAEERSTTPAFKNFAPISAV